MKEYMKTINIILLILIVIGVALLATQKLWVPPLVSMIIEREGVQQSENYELEAPVPPVEEVPQSDMNNWTWVMSEVSAQGTQFSYPSPFPVTYITPQNWPPEVTMAAGDFSCVEGNSVGPEGGQKQTSKRTIGESEYCVGVSAEGAAGSTYTTYEYMTAQGDFLVTVNFILRTPQCMNYDGKEQMACKTQQETFNVDALVERIASSITMQ